MPTNILMPALSPTMTEGTLAKWLVREGDEVRSGDLIAEIETDKATMEVEAVDEGTVAKILVNEGSEGVAVNAVLAVLVEEGEAFDESAIPPAAPAVSVPSAPAAQAGPQVPEEPTPLAMPTAPSAPPSPPATALPAPQPLGPTAASERIKASPLARRIAASNHLDLGQITGSGPGGRIIKRDVAGVQPHPAPRQSQERDQEQIQEFAPRVDGPTPFAVHQPSSIRKIIAKRLSESSSNSPHIYLTVDMELDSLLVLRKQINAAPEALKVSVNDMLILACGRALKAVPEANAGWVGEVIHRYSRVDISVAVASDRGLVTPVVRGVDHLSLSQIADAAGALVAKARAGKILPEEMQGGSFSISNLGMMGIKQFTSIINPPQGAILAVGAGEQRPVVKNDALTIATVMTCTLSADHRVIDGALAAELITRIKSLVENPVTMLI